MASAEMLRKVTFNRDGDSVCAVLLAVTPNGPVKLKGCASVKEMEQKMLRLIAQGVTAQHDKETPVRAARIKAAKQIRDVLDGAITTVGALDEVSGTAVLDAEPASTDAVPFAQRAAAKLIRDAKRGDQKAIARLKKIKELSDDDDPEAMKTMDVLRLVYALTTNYDLSGLDLYKYVKALDPTREENKLASMALDFVPGGSVIKTAANASAAVNKARAEAAKKDAPKQLPAPTAAAPKPAPPVVAAPAVPVAPPAPAAAPSQVVIVQLPALANGGSKAAEAASKPQKRGWLSFGTGRD